MKVGYARVSTVDQNLDMQMDALKKENCKKIFQDHASGVKSNRDGLERALDFMRGGDTLVVWKLDRLGRSLKHLIDIINLLNEKGMYFKSLQENIDTSSSGGNLIFHVFGALAEFERDMISDRTLAGMAAAKERGRVSGRPRKLNENNRALALSLMEDKSYSAKDVCKTLGISKTTLYRNLQEYKVLRSSRKKKKKLRRKELE